MRLQVKIGKLLSEKIEAVVIGLFEKEKLSSELKDLDDGSYHSKKQTNEHLQKV